MDERCGFYNGSIQCALMPESGGMCPRHTFLVTTLGYDEAVKVERGEQCALCLAWFDKDHIAPCPECGTNTCDRCFGVHGCPCGYEGEDVSEDDDEEDD